MTIENDDIRLEGKRKYISFNPTIHMGHIFIVITVLISTTGAWFTTQSRLELLESYNNQRMKDTSELARTESEHYNEVMHQIEDLHHDVTLILTQSGGFSGITRRR